MTTSPALTTAGIPTRNRPTGLGRLPDCVTVGLRRMAGGVEILAQGQPSVCVQPGQPRPLGGRAGGQPAGRREGARHGRRLLPVPPAVCALPLRNPGFRRIGRRSTASRQLRPDRLPLRYRQRAGGGRGVRRHPVHRSAGACARTDQGGAGNGAHPQAWRAPDADRPLGSGIHQEPYHYYGGYTPYWYHDFLGAAGFSQIRVEANAGSFRFFAQESIRFVQTTRPFKLGMPLPLELLWLPLWALLAPLLALAIPWSAVIWTGSTGNSASPSVTT